MENYIKEKKITATVKEVRWERIFLHLDVKVEYADPEEKKGELCFYAVDQLYHSPAMFKITGAEDDVYHLKLNVTNGGENVCLPSSEYRIFVCRDDCIMADCETDAAIVGEMDNFSRVYLFSEHTKGYAVSFYVEEETETLPFRFCILGAEECELKFPEKLGLWEALCLGESLKESWFSKRNVIRTMYSFFCKIYASKRKNTILLMSEQNDTIRYNLKAVADQIGRASCRERVSA